MTTDAPAKPTYRYVIHHKGYRENDIAGLERTTDGHGPMVDTGERVEGRTVLECPTPWCQWRGTYTFIEPLTAAQAIGPLQRRNAALQQQVNLIAKTDPATGQANPRAASITASDRMEIQRNVAEVERLRALPPDAVVGGTFVKRHDGSLVIVDVFEEGTRDEAAPDSGLRARAAQAKRSLAEQQAYEERMERLRESDQRKKAAQAKQQQQSSMPASIKDEPAKA